VPGSAVCTLRLDGRADAPCLERVHDLVDELWARVPEVQPADRYRFETAVIEVAGNIVEHGGPDVRLLLWLQVHEDRLEAQFRDTGRAVDLTAIEGHVPDLLAEDGRGLALARATADDVSYRRTGHTNSWWVIKRRSSAG
jgi:serine/threonine-protein kinase RsbW